MKRTAMWLVACASIAGCTRGPHPSGNASEMGEVRAGAQAPTTPPPPTPQAPPSTGTATGTATGTGTAPGTATPAATPTAAGPLNIGGVTWTAPAPFVSRPPASAMRAAEYAIEGTSSETVLVVFFFGVGQGGSVEDNLRRWIGQFQQPDGRSSDDAAEISRAEIHGLRVTRIDLRGSFGGTAMTGAPAQGTKAGYRLLGAIVEGGDGPVFLKLTGPEAEVARGEAAFAALVESVAPAR